MARVALDTERGLVVVRDLPPGEWQALVDEYPPPLDQPGPWHAEEFPPALIGACVVSIEDRVFPHGMPLSAARQLWDTWEPDVTEELFEVCLRLSSPRPLEWARRRLDTDPQLALEVAYCTDKGLRPSEFADWSHRDRDLVLAQWLKVKTSCPGCAVPWELMQDYDGADIEERACVWCEQRRAALESIPEEHRERVHLFIVPRLPGAQAGDG